MQTARKRCGMCTHTVHRALLADNNLELADSNLESTFPATARLPHAMTKM